MHATFSRLKISFFRLKNCFQKQSYLILFKAENISIDKPEFFLVGFMGVKQNKKTLELRPEIGWAIRDTGIEGIKDKDTDYKDDILNPNGN